MRLSITRQWLGAIALCGVLAFVAACSGSPASGSSSSLSPTAPTGFSSPSNGPVLFQPACFDIGDDDGDGICNNEDPCPDVFGVECEGDPGVGRFTGGGFQFDENDVKVTRGFTIHCDNVLSNNFEVNWAGGNNFHMEKNSQISTVCTKPFVPNPPDAPVSRIEVTSAAGTLNKLPASIYFVLEDHGEPGTADRAYIQITQGAFVFTVGGSAASPDLIDGGNIQAHFDQPHGNKPVK